MPFRKSVKKRRSNKTICYTGFGAKKSGNHSVKQFTKTMRKHHLYNCIDAFCKKTNDKKICALSRKCNRRNKRKRRFTAKKWVEWSGAHYGKCLRTH